MSRSIPDGFIKLREHLTSQQASILYRREKSITVSV